MDRLQLRSFGPIREADVHFGDLTVLVGPQASGKSLFVQLFKALVDAAAIRSELKKYGFDWLRGSDPVADYCATYFGGGLGGLVTADTEVQRDGKLVTFKRIAKPPGAASDAETVFLIPAQRVLVLQDGWPKPFQGYSSGDPYSMRHFSELLRLLMDGGIGPREALFPQPRRLKSELKRLLDKSIYVGGKLHVELDGVRKRIVLTPRSASESLPFSAWSAGQREFTPLLLGLYHLIPPTKVQRRGDLTTAIIEEPEMGLHPRAIVTFGLIVLELLHRGYRVIVSTHSSVFLDLVWALKELRGLPVDRSLPALRDVFGVKMSADMKTLLKAALELDVRVYYFDRISEGDVITRDISSLDPAAEDKATAGWGGLSGHSGQIADIVGRAITAERVG